MSAPDPQSWSGEPAEFDDYAAEYQGGLDNPIKRLMGSSPDQFIAVKARWLLRQEPALRTGGLAVLDYGCGVGSLMRVLIGLGAKGAFTGCDISTGMLRQVGIKAEVAVDFPHPRHYTIKTSPEFMALKARLTEEIRVEAIAADH